MKKITLDAREMEHPKPLQLALQALREMDEQSYFYMIHRKEPIPLIELAKDKEFVHLSREVKPGLWHILISKNDTVNLEEYLDV